MLKFIATRLQYKLIVAFVLILTVPVIVLGAINIPSTYNQLVSRSLESALADNQVQAQAIAYTLKRAEPDAIYLVQTPALQAYGSHIILAGATDLDSTLLSVADSLRAYLRNAPEYDSLALLDTKGHEVVRIRYYSGGTAIVVQSLLQDRSQTDYFKVALALKPGEVYASPVALNVEDDLIERPFLPVIHFSTPLYASNGQLVGIVVTNLLASTFLNLVKGNNPNETAYLVDATDGTYLAGPDPARLFARDFEHHRVSLNGGLPLSRTSPLPKGDFLTDHPQEGSNLLTSESGAIFGSPDYPTLQQVYTRISVPDFPQLHWLLYRTEPSAEILGNIDQQLGATAALLLVSLLVAILAAIAFTRTIVHPVQELARAAGTISQGNWDVPIPSAANRDEIGELGKAFSKMSGELKTIYETLDERVRQRTADLQTSNHKLEIAQKQAEEASRAKSVFLSNMSHELRTPLNVVIGYSSGMLDMPELYQNVILGPMHKRDVQLIKESGYYLLGLINDILDLSKIEAGKLDLQLSSVSLPELFKGIVATSIGLVKDKPIQIRPDFPGDLPLVNADPIRIRQIVLNLMSNAIKFTQTGSVTLHAHAEDGQVQVSVIDTGIGIPEKALAHIFDRYEQADSNIEKVYGGTGLGLDISKQLARMHGGNLTVASKVGQGSTFSFTLPLAAQQHVEGAVSVSSNGASSSVRILPPPEEAMQKTIMIVEDEQSMREMMRRILEGAQYVVVDTHDGAVVMNMALGLLPDLIILDIHLPSVDGWELLDNLKKNPETAPIPVMVCTVNEDEQRAFEMGTSLYIRKPFSAEEFLACTQKLLRNSLETNKGQVA